MRTEISTMNTMFYYAMNIPFANTTYSMPWNDAETKTEWLPNFVDMVDMLLKSESGVYVVFYGTGKVRYEGDIQHCFAYYTMYSKWMGFQPVIYSIEEYKRMIAEINEAHRKHGLDEI